MSLLTNRPRAPHALPVSFSETHCKLVTAHILPARTSHAPSFLLGNHSYTTISLSLLTYCPRAPHALPYSPISLLGNQVTHTTVSLPLISIHVTAHKPPARASRAPTSFLGNHSDTIVSPCMVVCTCHCSQTACTHSRIGAGIQADQGRRDARTVTRDIRMPHNRYKRPCA